MERAAGKSGGFLGQRVPAASAEKRVGRVGCAAFGAEVSGVVVRRRNGLGRVRWRRGRLGRVRRRRGLSWNRLVDFLAEGLGQLLRPGAEFGERFSDIAPDLGQALWPKDE